MLARRDPFRELAELNETFNRFFDNFLNVDWMTSQSLFGDRVPLDLSETAEGYHVKVSLPGLRIEDLDITFSNNVLNIKGEIRPDSEGDSPHYHLRERWYGSFQRSLTLPVDVDADNIQASYEAGVLTLFLPKSEEVKPKRIPVQSKTQTEKVDGKVAAAA